MHNGQGEALPAFTKLTGQWISKPEVFLYEAKDAGPTTARFPMKLEFKEGGHAIGFALDQLAAALAMTPQQVRMANGAGLLQYLGVTSGTPTHGGKDAVDFNFQIGERHGTITMEDEGHSGTS